MIVTETTVVELYSSDQSRESSPQSRMTVADKMSSSLKVGVHSSHYSFKSPTLVLSHGAAGVGQCYVMHCVVWPGLCELY